MYVFTALSKLIEGHNFRKLSASATGVTKNVNNKNRLMLLNKNNL